MSMFCFQCQETANGLGCTKAGVCGKTAETSNLQDLLIYNLKGLSCLLQRDSVSRNLADGEKRGLALGFVPLVLWRCR